MFCKRRASKYFSSSPKRHVTTEAVVNSDAVILENDVTFVITASQDTLIQETGKQNNELKANTSEDTFLKNYGNLYKESDFVQSLPVDTKCFNDGSSCNRPSLESKSLVPNIQRRRPGKLYKQKILGMYKGRKSLYFKTKGCPSQTKWLPPRSPYCLIQEDLYHNPWQLLIATIFLTKTQAQRAIPQILKFLEKWPTPQSILTAQRHEIVEFLKPLGIQNVRSSLIQKFTVDFLEKDWIYPEELHGIGKYGNDSYRIFCAGEWRDVIPEDTKLNLYKDWLVENAERLGL